MSKLQIGFSFYFIIYMLNYKKGKDNEDISNALQINENCNHKLHVSTLSVGKYDLHR